jgi:hypothetical protein
MSQLPAENEKQLKLMADLATSWSSQQSKVNRSIAIQDLELRDNLMGSLTRFVLNAKTDYEMSKASMTFLGRIGDLISTGSFEVEKKLNVAKTAIKVLLKPDALENVNNSRLCDIDQGVSVVPGVLSKDEWIEERLNLKDPFIADPGFSFDLDHDAISSAVKSYLKEIEAGSEAMPDYQHLCQQVNAAKLQNAQKADFLAAYENNLEAHLIDPLKIDGTQSTDKRPRLSETEKDVFNNDLGL